MLEEKMDEPLCNSKYKHILPIISAGCFLISYYLFKYISTAAYEEPPNVGIAGIGSVIFVSSGMILLAVYAKMLGYKPLLERCYEKKFKEKYNIK